MLKSAGALLIPLVTEYFKEIFKSGSYPDRWTRAVTVPIHKKGNTWVANNYPRISLLSLIGKCYITILKEAIAEWFQDNKTAETQAGFYRRMLGHRSCFTLPLHKNVVSPMRLGRWPEITEELPPPPPPAPPPGKTKRAVTTSRLCLVQPRLQ